MFEKHIDKYNNHQLQLTSPLFHNDKWSQVEVNQKKLTDNS